jgi:hypothetical protein
VNILVGLEILKETFTLTDEQLYENYHFNYLYQKALGVDDINEHSFSIRTLYNFRFSLGQFENRTGMDLFSKILKDGCDKIISEELKDIVNEVEDSAYCKFNKNQVEVRLKTLSKFLFIRGFVSEYVRHKCEEHEIDFISTSIRRKEQSNGKINSISFVIGENKLIEKCPNGERPIKQKLKEEEH